MKSALLPMLVSLLLFSACAALEKAPAVPEAPTWSSADPGSIPHAIRRRQFERGNLVGNPAFEAGRLTGDGPHGPFLLAGWTVVGSHVRWVEREAAPDTQGGGGRCIRITRQHANETDAAEGIISDYIPVIPGNYDFTYHIRLQGIVSNQRRLGVRLFDAIAVRVFFFDAEQRPLDPACVNPVGGGLIDNSNKGFSFANYWRIDHFPWGKVRGRTYNYPFSEGDIPDRTRYVRLFFGLKGTGSIWLDDIYFGYSKWNFTALERFEPLFGRPLRLTESLIPTPKQVHAKGRITYYHPSDPSTRPPVIILPENPTAADRSAASLMQATLDAVFGNVLSGTSGDAPEIRVLDTPCCEEEILASKLIISIGNSRLFRTLRPDLGLQAVRGKAQGYVVKTERVGGSHALFLMGETSIGNYYAAATAAQLFENDRFVYHDATVVDYPDFLGRSYVFKNWRNESELRRDLDAVQRMSTYKLNTVYYGYDRAKKTWYRPDALYRQGLAATGRLFAQNGVMHLAVMVNPYSHFPMEAAEDRLDEALRNTWTHSDPQSLETLKEVYRIGLDAGADTIMYLADDFVPHVGTNRQDYALYTADDKKRFVNLQNAQAYVINRLKTWLDSEYPGTRLEFCPPWYSNEHIDRSDGKAESYLEELAFQIPGDVAVIWTGPTIRSLSIDMADLHRFGSLIGRWPMIWDNTLYARNIETRRYGGYVTNYPGKVRLCNLFEPYDTDMPDQFQHYNDGRRRYTNGNAYSEVYKIKYATVADYLWNTAAYQPERSLWKVLCRTYGGPAGARALIRFSDAYYAVYGICLQMEKAGATAERLENGREALKRLSDGLLEISRTLPQDEPLLKELARFRSKQEKRVEKLSRNLNPQPS